MGGLHGDGLAGHLGRTRVVRRCQDFFYWPNFHRDLTAWCARCVPCNQQKPPPHPIGTLWATFP